MGESYWPFAWDRREAMAATAVGDRLQPLQILDTNRHSPNMRPVGITAPGFFAPACWRLHRHANQRSGGAAEGPSDGNPGATDVGPRRGRNHPQDHRLGQRRQWPCAAHLLGSHRAAAQGRSPIPASMHRSNRSTQPSRVAIRSVVRRGDACSFPDNTGKNGKDSRLLA